MRYLKITLVVIFLLVGTLGAAFAGFHIHLKRCPDCGEVGQWQYIHAIRTDFRKCSCGIIQKVQTVWGFKTGAPSTSPPLFVEVLPPLRVGTREQISQLKQLILSHGGTRNGDRWQLEQPKMLRRGTIESIVELSTVSVIECPVVGLYAGKAREVYVLYLPFANDHCLQLVYDNSNDDLYEIPGATIGRNLLAIRLERLPQGTTERFLTFAADPFGRGYWLNEFE